MLGVWGLCVAAYVLLPYQLLERELTTQGVAILAVFIAAYLVGTLMVPTRRLASLVAPPTRINADKAEMWLMVASGLATVFFILDAKDKYLFDLAVAYELRSETSDALLKGEASNSSVWFQMAFLLYPAGYVYTAVHALFARGGGLETGHVRFAAHRIGHNLHGWSRTHFLCRHSGMVGFKRTQEDRPPQSAANAILHRTKMACEVGLVSSVSCFVSVFRCRFHDPGGRRRRLRGDV